MQFYETYKDDAIWTPLVTKLDWTIEMRDSGKMLNERQKHILETFKGIYRYKGTLNPRLEIQNELTLLKCMLVTQRHIFYDTGIIAREF